MGVLPLRLASPGAVLAVRSRADGAQFLQKDIGEVSKQVDAVVLVGG